MRFAGDRWDVYRDTRSCDCSFRLVQFLLHDIGSAPVGRCEVV